MKKVFTTGQVAKICKVAPRTVSKWFDSGRSGDIGFRGRRTAGFPASTCSGSSRNTGCRWATSNRKFTRRSWSSVPMPRCSGASASTSAKGMTSGSRPPLRASRPASAPESFHPDCIIIDLAVGRIEAGQIAQNLRKSQDHLTTILVALTSDEPNEDTYNLGFNDAFKKPFDGALLAERVRRLISQKKADEPSEKRGPTHANVPGRVDRFSNAGCVRSRSSLAG